jgi:hypothetical protein
MQSPATSLKLGAAGTNARSGLASESRESSGVHREAPVTLSALPALQRALRRPGGACAPHRARSAGQGLTSAGSGLRAWQGSEATEGRAPAGRVGAALRLAPTRPLARGRR